MATKFAPPPPRDDARFDDWVRELYIRLKDLIAISDDLLPGQLTPQQAVDLTDGGDSSLHFHASDRARANHTGTQPSATISDLSQFVLGLISSMPTGNHPNLSGLSWTSSGHTGTATTVPGFNGSGVAELLTRTGTGTIVVMSAAPTISGTATFSGSVDHSGSGGRILLRTNDATRANRTLLQDRTTDAATNVGILPNGTSNVGAVSVFASSDPDNTHLIRLITGATTVAVDSTIAGTGTQRSLDFNIAGVTKFSISTAGNASFTGNVTVNGTALDFPTAATRIQLRTDDATRANRTMFQDRTTNAGTNAGVIPNGSSNTAAWTAFGGSDPDNTHIIQLVTGASLTAVNSNKFGSGTQRALELQIAGTTQFGIETDGRLYGVSMHNTGTVTGTAKQYLASGTYTPTLTGVSNVDSTTARTCQWMRVGNVVTVSGNMDVDATSIATGTVVGISLPIASSISASEQCAGTCSAISGTGQTAGIIGGNAPSDRADMSFNSVSTAGVTYYFHFTYLVL